MDRLEMLVNNELVKQVDENGMIEFLIKDGFSISLIKEAQSDNMLKPIYDSVYNQKFIDSQATFSNDQIIKVTKTKDISNFNGSLSIDGGNHYIYKEMTVDQADKKRREFVQKRLQQIRDDKKLINKIKRFFN